MEKFIIVKDFVKHVSRFNLRGRTLEFKLRDLPPKEEPVSWIKDAIGDVIAKATEDLLPTDQVAFNFGCKDFARSEGWIRFRPAAEVTLADIWGVISNIYQSNSSGLNTETFCLGVTVVRMPMGKGRGKNYNTFDEECCKRRGIIAINNKGNLCLPRALVVAKAFADKDPEYVKVRRDIGKLQTVRAQKLLEEAQVVIPEEGCGIPEIQGFQQHLPDYRIVVYKYGTKGRDVFFSSGQGVKNLNLIFHKGHFSVITSLTAAFCCNYYCEECHAPYNVKNKHRCAKSCVACLRSPPCDYRVKVRCADCLRTFKSQTCFDHHIQIGAEGSVCEQIRLCPHCLKTVKVNREHTCGEIFCKICQKHQPQGHMCFMQLDNGKPETNGVLFVFYDLETRQEKRLEDGSFKHEPNLCIFKQCCDTCIYTADIICKKCGLRLQKVQGETPIASFMIHLLQIRKKFKEVVVLAHNGQAFDHQFILNHILVESDLTPELIMRGSKIILMQLKNIKFIDSLNYFPMPLSALPKAFGLGKKFMKGYFPHLFNTEKNQKYVGPLPPIEYYSPDSMKEDTRVNFLKWHEAHKHNEFNFQKEFIEYCISDVEILTEACLKFREQMMTTTNVCPFTDACTIASACNKVFRRNFLKPYTIGIIPKGGYRMTDKQSIIALKWLVWEENQRKITIQHAARGQEAILSGLKVDGYSENKVFEFQGCYWHGCPSCFKYQRDEPLPDNPSETMNFRYESTVAKIERLRTAGYDVIEKWECDFRKEMQQNPEVEKYMENHPLLYHSPLNPRDAFYGGRTGNCRTYYKCATGEKIKYLDVCSLYPWVCKYGKYPIGHPKVFVGKQCKIINLQETNGLIKCKILPPQNLYHPVLPTKMNNKLMFVLCRSCGQNMADGKCQHSEEERALTDTWVIDEVLKALEKGYQIMDIFEVWKYQVEQYNIEHKTGGLFVEMMNKFIKIKQEASGWPGDCVTNKQKEKYIEAFFDREGIKLEFNTILKNSGLRCLAKLMLNSFWGKLGQQENQPKTKIVNNQGEFFNMMTNPSIYVNSVLPINEDVLVVNYSFKEESYDPISTVNVCLAAYTTAQARLKLYSYLEKLKDMVIYYDTDSIVFIQKEGECEPPTGDFIGDMTDELEAYGVGSYINEFVSGGPKNYAYKFYSTAEKEEKVVCKVKGITLNYNASKLVNFESIKDMVLNDSTPIKIISNNIRRTKDHEIVTKEETKIYRPNSLKRKFFDDHSSIPYGFKQVKGD